MSELYLQDKFLVPFIKTELGYREVKPNTVITSLIIEEDLQEFISSNTLNQKPYETLLRKYNGNAQALLTDLISLIQGRTAAFVSAGGAGDRVWPYPPPGPVGTPAPGGG